MLVGKNAILTVLSLCYSIVYHYNVEQFLQVCRPAHALNLLDLAHLMSTSLSSIFMMLYILR